jgi:hypothetical protein
MTFRLEGRQPEMVRRKQIVNHWPDKRHDEIRDCDPAFLLLAERACLWSGPTDDELGACA